jgi:hypothetical protein
MRVRMKAGEVARVRSMASTHDVAARGIELARVALALVLAGGNGLWPWPVVLAAVGFIRSSEGRYRDDGQECGRTNKLQHEEPPRSG